MREDKCRLLFRKIYFLVGKEFWKWNTGVVNLSDEDEHWLAFDSDEFWQEWLENKKYSPTNLSVR